MLSGQQMNLEVLLMRTSLRSTLSSFFKHMCMRFSTTTPTETSFCRAAFYFWKLWECFEMFLDVLEFVTTMRMRRRCFWFCLEVNSNKLNSPNMVVRSLRRTFIFCMPPLPLQQHGTAETGEDQTMHVARARQLSWTDSLFPLCFLCGKGTEGIAVKPSWIWVVFCSYARRGGKPTQFDASARY